MENLRLKESKILVVAAHPDDEVLGCGGTIAKLKDKGHKVYVLIMGEGKTSRNYTDLNKQEEDLEELSEEIFNANKILGVDEVYIEKCPDNKFDTMAMLDIVKVIEKYKELIKPDIIFTHYIKDMNKDHQILAEATLVATRPLPNETVKKIYSFEILSSTEWNYPLTYSPNVFVDITKYFELKKRAMLEYKSELREYPHSRSIEAMDICGKYWSYRIGKEGHVEAFQLLREIL